MAQLLTKRLQRAIHSKAKAIEEAAAEEKEAFREVEAARLRLEDAQTRKSNLIDERLLLEAALTRIEDDSISLNSDQPCLPRENDEAEAAIIEEP